MLIEQYHRQHWGHSAHLFWQGFGRRLQNLGQWMERFSQLSDHRQQLLEMDDHMLKDIGLNRADARRMVENLWFGGELSIFGKK
jgi:uncharacterized protein YjiS (DUF1127 family)